MVIIISMRIMYVTKSIILLLTITLLSGAVLISSTVSADDNTSVVDQINITVPISCTLSGTGMDTHNANINNGLYVPDIGTTTLHAFCNDNEGFAIYAAGYTGNEVGGTNSNKLVGTSASGNATIESGIATSTGNPDVSNWAMKLTATQDSGDTTGTNAFTIDSAPNVALPSEAESGATEASFSNYHVVPNEYVKVAHKNSGTDMTATTGGVKLTTTYAAYISKTQPADTYSGQVIYTLVHPSSAAPVLPGAVAVNYNGNGKTFAGGESVNKVVYATSPMYIATTPLISKTDNISNDGTQNGSYPVTSGAPTPVPITATGANKMKVVIRYGFSQNTMMAVIEGAYDGNGAPAGSYEMLQGPATGTATYTFDGDTVTFYMMAQSAPTTTDGQDYGYFAQVYPIYATEQEGTEPSDEFASVSTDTGTYATTTDWYGSWYADINNTHYDFLDETEVKNFLENNITTLSGTTVDIYRGLTFTEAYTRASKTQDNGYYKQQELTKSMCNTIAITQNQTLKDVRDNNTYMVGRLKDGNCWMLDNLALDPTNPTTAANMNASNTNATQEAITNLLNGGSSTTGWSNTAVANMSSGWDYSNNSAWVQPWINNTSKDTLVTSYGPASTNGQAKVGIYYNFCAASASTYCYAGGQGIDVPDTIIDAPQDICPANWRMPTGGNTGEYYKLAQKYGNDATSNNSLQYNLSTPLSGCYYANNVASGQGSDGYWWSSTYGFSNGMYGLYVSPNNVNPYNFISRDDGQSMRCLMAD